MSRGVLIMQLCLLWGCEQTIDVLALADASMLDDNEEDAGDSSAPPIDAGSCGVCPQLNLCAVDGCVASAGITDQQSGLDHACMVRDGRLYCWGHNETSQLGLGDSMNRDSPTRVGTFNDWLAVSAGEAHSCALRSPGVLYCWGYNDKGQLGLEDSSSRATPERVGDAQDWVRINCGGDNCCAIRGGGAMYCWGDNLEGKPAQDDPYGSPDVITPTEVMAGTAFARADLGQGHACAIRDDGALFCWGRNMRAETGLDPQRAQIRVPTRVGDANDWVEVACGQHHSCGVRADGSLWCWGETEFNEAGSGATLLDEGLVVVSPAPVGAELDWVGVAVGWFHSCGRKGDGSLYCWGRAIEGQLGQGGGDPVPDPTQVMPPAFWSSVTMGRMHTCALDDARGAYCFGENDRGQLGVGDFDRRNMPAAQ